MKSRSLGKRFRSLVSARAVALLLLAVLVVACFWAFWTGPVQTQKDAAVVFCLSPAEHDDLVDAAVALDPMKSDAGERLNVAGRELTPETWRKERGSDFRRACEALFVSRSQATGGGRGILETLEAPLLALVGIVGGALPVLWVNAIDRRREQADALRSAADAFASATQTFVQAWTATSGARPPDQDVHACRHKLVARLGRVNPRWPETQELRTELSEGSLGQGLTRDWVTKDQAARERRAGELRAHLDRLERVISDVAYALEHPGRPRSAQRDRPADSQT